MLKKISIRWRLTILSALLLSVCCIGLTIVMNLSAFHLVDKIDASIITTPATEPTSPQSDDEIWQSLAPSTTPEDLQAAKQGFGVQSLLYMLLVILGGGALTYCVSGKVLKPLDVLNGQVKNINVHNLSETLPVPPTKDEISELTISFNDMTDKLNDAFMIQQRFSASAAHELRTPLAVMQTKVDVFKKKEGHTREDYAALLTVFEKQIVRLRGLVGNLLDMTNMDDEREKSSVCLHDMFEDMIAELSVVAKRQNISFSLNCDDSCIVGNIDLLYRAFYNLIENAIKYNVASGSVHINVAKTETKQVKLLISDSGIGIPDEMKVHIFEPFYRVDKSRSREMGGAGLGLSIVESIIKKQGGTIDVLDNETGGTCFQIVL